MPLQNRVAPTGAVIAAAGRGTFMGNRGILHDDTGRIVRASRNRAWLICRLDFKGRRRELMRPGTYTELFFLDEAVALAAGHRPCGECRREFYRAYIDAVSAQNPEPIRGAQELDRKLNASRQLPRTTSHLDALPDGTFLRMGDNDFRLLWQGGLHRWSPQGYTGVIPAAYGLEFAAVLTPELSIHALRKGYPVQVHPTARQRP